MSSPSDADLTSEVASLLKRTDALLSEAEGPHFPQSRSSTRLSFQDGLAGTRGLARNFSLQTSTEGGDALSEAANRLRGSFELASRRFTSIKRSAGSAKPIGSDSFRQRLSPIPGEAQAPRLTDGTQEQLGSLGDPSATSSGFNIPSSLPATSGGGGRTYNSFGGLHVMVDDLAEPASPCAAAGERDNHTAAGVVGGGTYGKVPSSGARPLSRLGSPSMSPRSPLRRGSGAVAPAAPSVSPVIKASRRSQLAAYLSKDFAQPYEVAKFKTELKGNVQSTAEVNEWAGSLQEKFERVNRKLNNWDLVETAATERFSAAMEAALESIFSRINLSLPDGAPKCASAAAAGSDALTPSHARGDKKRCGLASARETKQLEGSVCNGSGQQSDVSAESESESVPSTSSRLYTRAGVRSTATGTEARRRSSDSDTSGRSSRQDGSRASGAQRKGHGSRGDQGQHRDGSGAEAEHHGTGMPGLYEQVRSRMLAASLPHYSLANLHGSTDRLPWAAALSQPTLGVAAGGTAALDARSYPVNHNRPSSLSVEAVQPATGVDPGAAGHPPRSAPAYLYHAPPTLSAPGGLPYTQPLAGAGTGGNWGRHGSNIQLVPEQSRAASGLPYQYVTVPAETFGAAQQPHQGVPPVVSTGSQHFGHPWKLEPALPQGGTSGNPHLMASEAWVGGGFGASFQGSEDYSTIYRPRPDSSTAQHGAPAIPKPLVSFSTTTSPVPSAADIKAPAHVLWQTAASAHVSHERGSAGSAPGTQGAAGFMAADVTGQSGLRYGAAVGGMGMTVPQFTYSLMGMPLGHVA